MKKEYFLLILIIASLSAYLFFHNKNQDNYKLPEIAKIDQADIESIELIKNDKTIICFKENDKWVVTQDKFSGNQVTFKEMTAALENLKITTLISEKEDFKRYDLDADKAIKVIARDKNNILREFTLGKTAPTQKHTFIALKNPENNKINIFHASGNLRRMFNKSVDNLRDKQIQQFDIASIQTMEIIKDNLKRTFTKTETKDQPWKSFDKKDVKQNELNSLIESLSDLRCSNYIENKDKASLDNKTPLLAITLETEQTPGQSYIMKIFPKTDQDKYMGLSSQNKYLFILENHVADNIISHMDKLLNLKPKNANDGNS